MLALTERPSSGTVMSVRHWARNARRGEALLYHTGLLMRDRQNSTLLSAVADCLWEMYEKGLVALVQHRSGDSKYEYLAVKQ